MIGSTRLADLLHGFRALSLLLQLIGHFYFTEREWNLAAKFETKKSPQSRASRMGVQVGVVSENGK